MKVIRILFNVCRFFKLKLLRKYVGSCIQTIPLSTQVIVEKNGKLEIKGRLSSRSNGYICAIGKLTIEEGCFINNNVQITSLDRIKIDKNVIIGPNVVIVDHDHNYKSKDRRSTFVTDPIVIGEDVWIGANSVILKGTKIGKGCVVGAGSIVKGQYDDNTIIIQGRKTTGKKIKKSDTLN